MKFPLCDLINCCLRIPYFIPIMSSNILPTARYIISNYAHDRPVGHPPTRPTRQPIILTSHLQVWDLKDIEGDRHTLTLASFVTVSEDDFVWSYLDPEVPATEWVIQHYGGLGSKLYTITDPKTGGRAWTLKEGYTQVSLEDIIKTGEKVDPTQLWVFDIVLPNDGKSQKKV